MTQAMPISQNPNGSSSNDKEVSSAPPSREDSGPSIPGDPKTILRIQFINAVFAGDSGAVKKYLDNSFGQDPEQTSTLMNAFIFAARNKQVDVLNTLMDYTDKSSVFRTLPEDMPYGTFAAKDLVKETRAARLTKLAP